MSQKKTIAVFGATGQVGSPMTKELLQLGFGVVAIVRSRSARNEEALKGLEERGAKVAVCPDMTDVDAIAEAFTGCDTVVCSVPATEEVIQVNEPAWLKAALKAGVKRFVPNEFGAHTQGMDYGVGVLFDYKKKFQEELFASGIGWTLYFNGGIFDYLLPNLRFFRKITTFGDLDIPIYTHDIEDIGKLAARALTDDRTLNKCVQLDFNCLSQNEMLKLLKANFPDHEFEYEHFSSEYITRMKDEASDEVTAKKGGETDRERWGINNCIYVLGKLAGFNELTVRATELFPDYVCKKPETALKDPKFVFENDE